MTDAKSIFQSRTVWANLVGLLALVLAALRVPATALGDPSQVVDAILQVVAGLGFLASTAFRIAATKRIG